MMQKLFALTAFVGCAIMWNMSAVFVFIVWASNPTIPVKWMTDLLVGGDENPWWSDDSMSDWLKWLASASQAPALCVIFLLAIVLWPIRKAVCALL